MTVSTNARHTAVFAGTLAIAGVEYVDGVAVDVVGMRLRSVVIEHDTELGTVVACELPLDLYLGSSAASVHAGAGAP